jgi:hypothetical protein
MTSWSRKGVRRTAITIAAAVAFGVTAAGAQAAISLTRAELNGAQLRIEGGGAVPNHTIVVSPGSVSGTSDSNGEFRIERSSYSSSTCRVTVSDGTTSVSSSLSGCTPSTSSTGTSAVTLAPSSLAFGSQDTGTRSAPQSVTVTNTGSGSLFINSAAVPNTLDFTVVGDGCSGLTIAPGGSCTVSIVFSPSQAGSLTAAFVVTDNAPNSPQSVPLAGTGTTPAGTTAPGLAIDTQFMSCESGVCAVAPGSNNFVGNFFTTTFRAVNGTAPYTWSGALPAGLTLRSSGLVLGTPTALGTHTFQVTVTDATGATATGTFSLTVNSPPPPSPSGCQTGGTLKERLSGPSFNGRTPSGQAVADETRFSACGGFSLLSVQVKNVALPDGAVLWVTLDFMPVGTITVRGGSGTMPTYNLGRFGVSNDDVRVYSALPDQSGFRQILIGGFFS